MSLPVRPMDAIRAPKISARNRWSCDTRLSGHRCLGLSAANDERHVSTFTHNGPRTGHHLSSVWRKPKRLTVVSCVACVYVGVTRDCCFLLFRRIADQRELRPPSLKIELSRPSPGLMFGKVADALAHDHVICDVPTSVRGGWLR